MPQSRISLVDARSGQPVPAAPQPSVALSSIHANWDGLVVEHHRYFFGGEISEAYAEQHLLGLQLSPMTLEWRSQGRFQSRQLIPGDVCIYARGTSFQQRWDQALASLEPPVPVLHLYCQPDEPGYLAAQQSFAAEHPWFSVRKLGSQSHLPIIEVPDELTTAIERFVA